MSESFHLSSGVLQGSVLVPLLFTLYMKPLSGIFNNYGFNYHLYADDVQFYFTFDHHDKPNPNKLTNCLNAVDQWLCLNELKLNNYETQCILFRRKHQKFVENIFQNSVFKFSNSVKDLGDFLDCNISMKNQFNSAIKKCFFHICNIGKIRKYMDEKNCKNLVNVFVTTHLDYRKLCIMVCLTPHYLACKKCKIPQPGFFLMLVIPFT